MNDYFQGCKSTKEQRSTILKDAQGEVWRETYRGFVCIKGESFDGVSEWDGQRFQPTNRTKDFKLSGWIDVSFIIIWNTVATLAVRSHQRII